jgi:nucleoid DNA-binding protein
MKTMNNKPQPKVKPMTKTDLLSAVADKSGLTKKDVTSVLDALTDVIREQLSKKGPGAIALPGLAKISVNDKPAQKATTKANPFKPGEMMEVKAKPARRIVKVRPLKALKDMV